MIEYVKGKPYFSDVEKKLKKFPYLDKNIICDVLIVGAGIDGAIANYYFSNAGIDTVLIEKNKIGYTNTSCATSLLEYQLDSHANDLTDYFPKEMLLEIYKLGLESLTEIDKLINKLGNYCHYSKRPTLLYSLKDKDKDEIHREYIFRINNHFDCEYLTEENNPFPFELKAGIYCENGGAEFNPYLFTKQMIENSKNQARIFEHTEASHIIYLPDDKVKVITNYGIEIICNKIICSTGYNTSLFTKQQLCDKTITYSIVTNPIKDFTWKDKTMIQDNAEPYHYIRFSHDNRLIIGGEDIPFKNNIIKKNVSDKKYQNLLEYTKQLLPDIESYIKIDYSFSGVFSATDNNLAVIGEDLENKNLWYLLGYGANGIIYAIYGAKALLKLYKGKEDQMLKFFSPKRELP